MTQAECIAASEAAIAICCLARTESVCFDLEGKLNEDFSRNKTKKRTSMNEDVEGRWKKDEEEISRRSHSLSSSFQVDISDSGSAEEMDQKHCKLGAKHKWSAHADWSAKSDWSDDSSTTPIPPWRNKSLWRITTQTVEGLSEQPSSGGKQTFENQHEALLKKHAMEFSKLMKECEETKASGNGRMKNMRKKRKDGRKRLKRSFLW